MLTVVAILLGIGFILMVGLNVVMAIICIFLFAIIASIVWGLNGFIATFILVCLTPAFIVVGGILFAVRDKRIELVKLLSLVKTRLQS